jgi:signal transduction histidine kinase
MEYMVGAALSFAREDAAEEQSRALDLRALAETVAADATEAGQNVTLTPGDALVIPMRPRTLKRALVNIVDNAVRYAGDASIAVGREGDEAVIRVIDHGTGIPEAEREAVLKPFYRCEASRSRDTGGIGLGLSIAADAVSAHGGRIALMETPGGGLTVEVRLPGVR